MGGSGLYEIVIVALLIDDRAARGSSHRSFRRARRSTAPASLSEILAIADEPANLRAEWIRQGFAGQTAIGGARRMGYEKEASLDLRRE